MIFAIEDATLGGGVLLLALIVRAIVSDLIWRGIIKEVREELKDCREGRAEQSRAHASDRAEWREERGGFQATIQNLEGEVTTLRRQVHTDIWTGTDPESVRERVAEQRPQEPPPADAG